MSEPKISISANGKTVLCVTPRALLMLLAFRDGDIARGGVVLAPGVQLHLDVDDGRELRRWDAGVVPDPAADPDEGGTAPAAAGDAPGGCPGCFHPGGRL